MFDAEDDCRPRRVKRWERGVAHRFRHPSAKRWLAPIALWMQTASNVLCEDPCAVPALCSRVIMPKCVVLLAVAVVLFAAPTAARADGYVGPGIGIAFGNPSAQGLADFVFDASWLYQEPIGVELDMTYAPSFFGNQGAYGSNSVTTVMGNVMVAEREPGPPLPRGIHRGRTVRPGRLGRSGLDP